MPFFPFRQCLECIQGPSFAATTPSYAQLRDEARSVKLSTSHMGPDAVILKNGTRLCGTGGALGSAPIVQNKAFFQVDITQNGTWGIGLSHRSVELGQVPVVDYAWVLRNDGQLFENGTFAGQADCEFNEGDVIVGWRGKTSMLPDFQTVTFDHIDLKFYRNDVLIPLSISSVRGQVFPLIYVGNEAILDVKFRDTTCQAPPGFAEIMIEQTLL